MSLFISNQRTKSKTFSKSIDLILRYGLMKTTSGVSSKPDTEKVPYFLTTELQNCFKVQFSTIMRIKSMKVFENITLGNLSFMYS